MGGNLNVQHSWDPRDRCWLLLFTSLLTDASSRLPTAMRQLPSKVPPVQPCGLLTCLLLFGVIQRLAGNGKPVFSPSMSQPGLHVGFSSGKVTGAPGSIDLRPAPP